MSKTSSSPVSAAPELHPPLPRRRVLVIEDSVDTLNTMKFLLEELGQDVEVASRGNIGLQLLLEQRPDVAFVDVGMPGMDGYELARLARAAPNGATLYLVALTGYSGPQAVARSAAAGFDRHAAKPLDLAELISLLERPNR